MTKKIVLSGFLMTTVTTVEEFKIVLFARYLQMI